MIEKSTADSLQSFVGVLRRVRENDPHELAAVLAINGENVPNVGDVPLDRIVHFARAARHFFVAEIGGRVVGYLIALAPSDDYDSPNFLWFRERSDDFLYVDRIAVTESHRRRGLGRRLYEHASALARTEGIRSVTCEVNLEPRNDASLAFHEALGFTAVGEGEARGHRVRYLERRVETPQTGTAGGE